MSTIEEQQEYERIKQLFANVDEKQLSLIDGVIREAARIYADLSKLNAKAAETGLVKFHPENPSIMKELPIAGTIIKVRANYLNYIAKLSNILGRNVGEDDNDLEEFE